MTVSTKFRKVILGAAAVALLISPMLAMADTDLKTDLDNAEKHLAALQAEYKALQEKTYLQGAEGVKSQQNDAARVVALASELAKAQDAVNQLRAKMAALNRAAFEAAAAARRKAAAAARGVSPTSLPASAPSGALPYDITKNPAELEAVGALLDQAGPTAKDAITKLNECKKAAARLLAGIKDGYDAGSVKKLKDAELNCLKDLQGAISAISKGNSNAALAGSKVAAKISNLTKWQYATSPQVGGAPQLSAAFSSTSAGSGKTYSVVFRLNGILWKNVPAKATFSVDGKLFTLRFPASSCKNSTALPRGEGFLKTAEDIVLNCAISMKVPEGVQIAFNGTMIIMLYTASGQLVAQIPWVNGKQGANQYGDYMQPPAVNRDLAEYNTTLGMLKRDEEDAIFNLKAKLRQLIAALNPKAEGEGSIWTSSNASEAAASMLQAAKGALASVLAAQEQGKSNVAQEKEALEKALEKFRAAAHDGYSADSHNEWRTYADVSGFSAEAEGIIALWIEKIRIAGSIITLTGVNGVVSTKSSATPANGRAAMDDRVPPPSALAPTQPTAPATQSTDQTPTQQSSQMLPSNQSYDCSTYYPSVGVASCSGNALICVQPAASGNVPQFTMIGPCPANTTCHVSTNAPNVGSCASTR